jgi:WD40 repeat protein
LRTLLTFSLCCLAGAAADVCGDEPSTAPEARVLTAKASKVAFSPDGRMVLTGNAEGEVTVWDAHSGKRVRTVTQPAGVIRAVAWPPDGRLLAAAGSGKEVRLCEAETGREAGTLKGHTAVIQAIAFSPDGKTLASGSSDKTMRLWDIGKRAEVRALSLPDPPAGAKPSRGFPGLVFAVTFSPDSKTVAAGGGDGAGAAGELVLWNAGTGKEQRRLLGDDGQQVWAVAFTPNGKRLAAGFTGGSIRLFDVQTGKVVREFAGGDQLRGLAVSPDGRTVAAAIRNEIMLWDVATGELRRTLRGHSNWVKSIAFSPDGKSLMSGGSDGVRLWSLATDK